MEWRTRENYDDWELATTRFQLYANYWVGRWVCVRWDNRLLSSLHVFGISANGNQTTATNYRSFVDICSHLTYSWVSFDGKDADDRDDDDDDDNEKTNQKNS